MVTARHINNIRFENEFIFITVDGKELKFSLSHVSQKLKTASELERNLYKVSPSGYGIHWPLVDEDLAIDMLLKNSL
jgi:hypothetical protein